ncbi:MAG TPA: response regulator transcription factor [Acidimicrobiales bacterium]|nr:response regulator transcription factor [Acidimicrobiales bacterium]
MTAAAPLRAVLAEDSVILREGLAELLVSRGIEVVGTAGDADRLLRLVEEHRPDVAVVDIRMPPTHTDEGLRAALELRRTHPDVGILVFSQHIETRWASELLETGAAGVGYLLKERVAHVAEFVDALGRVARGGTALDPEVVTQFVRSSRRRSVLDRLTPREREVLDLMAEGRSNRAIAERLVVSERAVEKHVGAIFDKLDLPPSDADNRRVRAVVTYLTEA